MPIFKTTEIKNIEEAEKLSIGSFPTIMVNGFEIQSRAYETPCKKCSNALGEEINCRAYKYNKKNYDIIPKELLIEKIKEGISGKLHNNNTSELFKISNSTKKYFELKEKQIKSGCKSCKNGCGDC